MLFFFSSRRRHTRWPRDWSSDVCSSDLKSIVLIVDCEGVKVHPFKAKSYANTGLLIKPGMCRLYLIEISRYFLLKAGGGRCRIIGIANGAADNQVVGAGAQGVGGAERALLFVLVGHRTNAGAHGNQAIVDFLTQRGNLKPGGHHAGAAKRQGTTRT